MGKPRHTVQCTLLADDSDPFTIPTVSAASCNTVSNPTNAADINTALKLGFSGAAFTFYEVTQSPALTGS